LTDAFRKPFYRGLRFSSQAKGEPFEVAVLALQNLTIFPETVVPLGIGRPRSIAAVEAALTTEEKLLGCITVRPDSSDDTDAKQTDLFEVGTLVMIKRMERIDQACASSFRERSAFAWSSGNRKTRFCALLLKYCPSRAPSTPIRSKPRNATCNR
jgi:ATP-dependent Lon protease